jgi:hypothetical protein
MVFIRLSVLMVAIAISAPAHAQLAQPASITLDAGDSLPRAAQATRAHFLGSVDLYNVAVYADGSITDAARLASSDTPKAIRILILFEPDLQRRMPIDWQRELIPAVEPDAVSILRSQFAPIVRGDVVLIEYSPGKGTSVRVNKGVAVRGASHDLMLSFLDHFLGQRPLSEALKSALLRR